MIAKIIHLASLGRRAMICPMHPLRALGIYGFVVFVGGALAAPWLFWLCQAAAEHFSWAQTLREQPFHRFVNRAILGLALVGLWPLFTRLGARSWRAVGLGNPRGSWANLAAGFAVGFASLALVAICAVAGGARQFDAHITLGKVVNGLSQALLTAILVGFLEELLFRGAIFGALRRAHHWTAALGISSAIYALVHFFQKAPAPAEIHWHSGVIVLGRMLRGFVDGQQLVPGFFTLLLAGIILGWAYQRTGSLFLSIGLHAGWIFWLKLYGMITDAQPGMNRWFWGTARLIDGWLALLVLALVLAGLRFVPRKTSGPDAPNQL